MVQTSHHQSIRNTSADGLEAERDQSLLLPTTQNHPLTVSSRPEKLPAAESQFLIDAPNDSSPATEHNPATPTVWLRGLIALAVLYGVFCLGVWSNNNSTKPSITGPYTSTVNINATSMTNATPPTIVHVSGRVVRPGVYHLPSNARVIDAIQKAGGPLTDADTNAINLAARCEDGSRIEVPAKAKLMPKQGQADAKFDTSPVVQQEVDISPSQDMSTAPITPREIQASTKVHDITRQTKSTKSRGSRKTSNRKADKFPPQYLAKHPININTATAEQLQALPGIGPVIASKIIEYRLENGKFQSVDDLNEVKGIGEKKMEKIRPLITVS